MSIREKIDSLVFGDVVIGIIFLAIPILCILDFVIDGCIAIPLGSSIPVCGDDAKNELFEIVGGFALFGILLCLKLTEPVWRKNKKYLFLFGLAVVSMWLLVNWYKEYAAKAFEGEGVVVISSFLNSEKAFYVEYQKYSSDFRAIGYYSEMGPNYQLYTSKETVLVQGG